MGIVKLDEQNPNKDYLYDILENVLEFGNKYLSIVFMKTYCVDGIIVKLPRWITQRDWDNCDTKTKELAKKIKWM